MYEFDDDMFPTPMEEPKKVIRCHYIACEPVLKPGGK
jgi:hypothetical protein